MDALRSSYDQRGRDFSRGGQLCLSKALLSALAPSLTPVEVYTRYFEPLLLTNADNNISGLARFAHWKRQVRRELYLEGEPQSDPAFFSFFSHQDVNRLARVLSPPGVKMCPVIFWAETARQGEPVWRRLEYFHDFRAVHATAPRFQQDPSTTEATDDERVELTVLVVTSRHRLYRLSPSRLPDLDAHLSGERQAFFLRAGPPPTLSHASDLASGLARLLDLPRPPVELRCFTVAQLSAQETTLSEHWQLGRHGRFILVVSFCRLLLSSRNSLAGLQTGGGGHVDRHFSAKKCYFTTLASLGVEARAAHRLLNAQPDQVQVVCLHAGGQSMSRLGPDFVRQLVSGIVQTNNADRIDCNRVWSKLFRWPSATLPAEPPPAQSDDREKGEEEPWSSRPRKKICRCAFCASPDYEDNMNAQGPERLCKLALSCTDLLRALGQDTPEHLRLLETMVEWSVAAFDLESLTRPLDLEKPQAFFRYRPIDQQVQLQDHPVHVQKPILLCHMDAGDLPAEGDEAPSQGEGGLLLQAASDEESSIFDMMQRYWAAVKERHARAREKKKQLAQPLFELTARYRLVHLKTYAQHPDQTEGDEVPGLDAQGLDSLFPTDALLLAPFLSSQYLAAHRPSQAEKTWKNTLPGRLSHELQKLTEAYHIFSFYG